MFGGARNSHIRGGALKELDRRLRLVEHDLGRARNSVASRATSTRDEVTEAVSSALAALVDRFQSPSVRKGATEFATHAVDFGNDAWRRVSKEAGHRPLVTLGAALGVGLLIGTLIRR
jgi:ElaB/YqjD/DUF883 family membrane-anchored ribosome-binding protein